MIDPILDSFKNEWVFLLDFHPSTPEHEAAHIKWEQEVTHIETWETSNLVLKVLKEYVT